MLKDFMLVNVAEFIVFITRAFIMLLVRCVTEY